MSPVERTIEANNLSHHVLIWNEASTADVTVVLLHGFLDLAWSFQRVADSLAERFHVVAPDFRGHGDTEHVGRGGYYYFPDYVADLARLLPLVTRSRVLLVGHSMGGTVATLYAGAFADRVHKLALLEGWGPPGMHPTDAPERFLSFVRTVDEARARRLRPLASIEAAAERLRRVYPKLDPAWAITLARRATRPSPGGPEASVVWKFDPLHRTTTPLGLFVPQFAAFARRIRLPVLLVQAENSGLLLADQAERLALFANRRVETLGGAGHMMHLERPAELAAMLRSFFDEPSEE